MEHRRWQRVIEKLLVVSLVMLVHNEDNLIHASGQRLLHKNQHCSKRTRQGTTGNWQTGGPQCLPAGFNNPSESIIGNKPGDNALEAGYNPLEIPTTTEDGEHDATQAPDTMVPRLTCCWYDGCADVRLVSKDLRVARHSRKIALDDLGGQTYPVKHGPRGDRNRGHTSIAAVAASPDLHNN